MVRQRTLCISGVSQGAGQAFAMFQPRRAAGPRLPLRQNGNDPVRPAHGFENHHRFVHRRRQSRGRAEQDQMVRRLNVQSNSFAERRAIEAFGQDRPDGGRLAFRCGAGRARKPRQSATHPRRCGLIGARVTDIRSATLHSNIPLGMGKMNELSGLRKLLRVSLWMT